MIGKVDDDSIVKVFEAQIELVFEVIAKVRNNFESILPWSTFELENFLQISLEQAQLRKSSRYATTKQCSVTTISLNAKLPREFWTLLRTQFHWKELSDASQGKADFKKDF